MEQLVPIESPHRKDAVTLVRINNPLNPRLDRDTRVIDYFGQSILQIKEDYFPKNLPTITSLNGRVLSEYDLGNITLKHGDYLVFYPTIEGGGGGNSMMRSIAFLALSIISAIAAPYLAGMMGGGLVGAGGALTSSGMMVSGMIGMAINFIGGMLINALLPPTTPSDSGADNSTAYSFSPHSTQQQGLPIPKLYGTLKSHGNIITAFNYNLKDKSTANVLVSFCSGPIEDIYDYKVNDQRMVTSKDITFTERHGEIQQLVIPQFTETKSENPYNVRISHVEPWECGMGKLGTEAVVTDTTGQRYVVVANAAAWGGFEPMEHSFPASSFIIGDSYYDSYTGITWICDRKYPQEFTTTGNAFDALEVEINFPKGLVYFENDGSVEGIAVEMSMEISPSGKDEWMYITRKPKNMSPWSPYMEITKDDIITNPLGQGLYKVISGNDGTFKTGGPATLVFNTSPRSVTVEQTDTNTSLNKWLRAYMGTASGINSDAEDVADQLNGNVKNGGYDLRLDTSGSYLYCLLDTAVADYSDIFYLLSYVIEGATSAVNLKAEYYRSTTAGGWLEVANDGQNLTTDEDYSKDLFRRQGGNNKRWRQNAMTIPGGQSITGHWIRFSFSDASSGVYPKIGLLRPQKGIDVNGIIVYTDIRKNYSHTPNLPPNGREEAEDNGTWSAGYWTSSGGYLPETNLWVEQKTDGNDHSDHKEGDEVYPGTKDSAKRGMFWRYITNETNVISTDSIDFTKKFRAHTQKSIYYVVKSFNIYPKGYYDIRIERITKEASPTATNIAKDSYLTNIREIVYDDFSYPRHALLGVKALATEKLSGNLDVSAVIKGQVVQVNRPDEVVGTNDYNYRCILSHTATESVTKPITGTLWSNYWEQSGNSAVDNNITWSAVSNYSSSYKWVTEFSTNPAWICYDILSQPVIGMPSEVTVTVTGGTTPSIKYFECVISHTASSTNKPFSGQDWSKYWQVSGDIGYGSAWVTGTNYTARPMIRYEGIDPSRLDLTSFRTWADYCNELVYDENGSLERRHEFNGIFDAEMTLWEAALKVTEMSRSTLIWNGINIAVVNDVEATLPGAAVQLFTSGNVLPDSFKETFLPMEERVSEMEISFLNRDKDWEKDTIGIYNPDSETLSNKASIEPLGITKSSQAWRHAQYLINRNKYLKRTIEFETDLEAIACTVGDIFYFQNDVPRWGMAGGRIVSCSSDGYFLQIDQNITMTSTANYGVMVRLQDDTIATRDVYTLCGDELISNGNFTNGTSGWTAQSCSLSTTSGGKDGDCLVITEAGGDLGAAYQLITTEIGKTYRVYAYVKNGTLSSQSFIVYALDYPAFSSVGSFSGTTPASWTLIGFSFTATTSQTAIQLLKNTTTAGTIQFDEVSTREIVLDTTYGGDLLVLNSSLTTVPQQYCPYSLGIQNSEAKAFKVINISQSSELRAKITAIEYDADVFADDVEVSLVDDGDDWVEPTPIRPVTNLRVSELPSIGTPDIITQRKLLISFDRPVDDINYRTANVYYRFNRVTEPEPDETWYLLTNTSGNSAIIENAVPNYRYSICVTSVSKDNVESLWEDSPMTSFIVSDKTLQPIRCGISRISGLQILGNPNSTTFIGNDCNIMWNPITIQSGSSVAGGVSDSSSPMSYGIAFNTSGIDSVVARASLDGLYTVTNISKRLLESPNTRGAGTYIPQTWFKDYEIRVYNYYTGALLRTEYTTNTSYNYTYSKNYSDTNGALVNKFQIDVRARDINLNTSLVSSIIGYNAALTLTATSTSSTGEKIAISVGTEQVTTAPAGGETHYIGGSFNTRHDEAYSYHYIESLYTGTIVGAKLSLVFNNTPSGGTGWTAYIRKNDTTDYTVQAPSFGTSSPYMWTNMNMNVTVSVGDKFAFKSVIPYWATKPNYIRYGGYIVLQLDS